MNETENKKECEMSYLLTPDISEDKIDSEVAELKNIITENGGDIVQTNPLEKKRLAYPVKKQNQAYFGVVYFNIDKDELDKIKKILALHKKVIRFLILNKTIKPKPSMAAAQKPAKTPAPTQSFDQKLASILKG
ncbi:MAG: 30S ribosomal protein S6 [Candidatus Azambacteria bacterium]|nr:30S ribosomal protein S6 [Candidatus Azambacteria bacterium]